MCLVFGDEFLDFFFVEVFHLEDGVLLFFCFFKFLLEYFYLVDEHIVLLDGEFPLMLEVLVPFVV